VWYLCGLALLSGETGSAAECNASLIPEPEPLEREDCLFLDVIVPKAIFSSAAEMRNGTSTDKATATGAPIMVWIYGGGFTFGKKYGDGDPTGLMDKARQEDPAGRGVIYVTLNYRVSLPFLVPTF
jgi:cholinesterase